MAKFATDEDLKDTSWRQRIRDRDLHIRVGSFTASTATLVLLAVSRGCPAPNEAEGIAGGCDTVVEAGGFDTTKYAWYNFPWLVLTLVVSVLVMLYSLKWVIMLYKLKPGQVRTGCFSGETGVLQWDAFFAVLAIVSFIGAAVTTNQYLGDTAASTMDASQGPPALFSPDWATLRCGVAASFFTFFFLALSVYGSAAPKSMASARLGAKPIEQLELTSV